MEKPRHTEVEDIDHDVLKYAQRNLNRQPTKSILKNKDRKRKSEVKWDEDNLRQIEDERVPRMKIEEPNTPFRRGSAQDLDLNNFTPESMTAEVESRRSEWENVSTDEEMSKDAVSDPSDHELSSGNASDNDRRHAEFAKKRKEHYHFQARKLLHGNLLSRNKNTKNLKTVSSFRDSHSSTASISSSISDEDHGDFADDADNDDDDDDHGRDGLRLEQEQCEDNHNEQSECGYNRMQTRSANIADTMEE